VPFSQKCVWLSIPRVIAKRRCHLEFSDLTKFSYALMSSSCFKKIQQKYIITLVISNWFQFIDTNSTHCISGAAIDLSSLIVVEGKACWDLYIDGLVVSSDGNLLDALAAAVKVICRFYCFSGCFPCSFKLYLLLQVLVMPLIWTQHIYWL
jgi:hypothetical protein